MEVSLSFVSIVAMIISSVEGILYFSSKIDSHWEKFNDEVKGDSGKGDDELYTSR